MGKISPLGMAICPKCGANVQTTRGKLNDHAIGTGWNGDKRVKREICQASGGKP